MDLPPLLILQSEQEYRDHYVRTLVNGPPIVMPDGTSVLFYESIFSHAFYGYSSKWLKEKDIFDIERAKRMDWIRAALLDINSQSYVEMISVRKIHRLLITGSGTYLVITELIGKKREKFITAFPCGADKATHVRRLPKWK